MALDERYIVASDLESYFVDKDSGLPLADGTLTFYRDTARNVPKVVYQLSGSPPSYTYTSMGAQITLSAVGTVQNSGGDNEVIYYYPYDDEGNLDLYYVVCRNSDGIEQFSREAWPNITSGSDPTQDQTSLQNQISNPTFTNVFINEGKTTTFTVSAASNEEFEIAPGWDLIISGTGTVIVERIAATGNENIPTSPPYLLDVQVSVGITECLMRQRFPYNSGLWSSTSDHPIFLSGSFVARNESVGTTGIQMFYEESSGGSPIIIVDASFEASYEILMGATSSAIPQSTNTDSGKDGYIDIYLSFIQGSHIRVTAIQVIPTATSSINIVPYDTNSSNREEALQGDYYIPRLVDKRINSFLIGWDFQSNPFQFGLTGGLATVGATYIVDQTIAHRGSSGNVVFSLNPATFGLLLDCAGSNDSFYLMQYLNKDQVKNMLGTRLSVNVLSYQAPGSDPATVRVYLFRGTFAATFPALPNELGTIDTAGVFTLTQAGWAAIPRSGLDTPQATLNILNTASDINDGNSDYGFSGWEITDSNQIADTDKFAIVVTFGYIDAGTEITVNSISCVPGDLPCRPGVLSLQETLLQCQYYFETSYPSSTHEGTVTSQGSRMATNYLYASGGFQGFYLKTFEIVYNTIKRTIPVVRLYSPQSATPDQFTAVIYRPATGIVASAVLNISVYTGVASGVKSIFLNGNNATEYLSAALNAANEGYINYHFVADARLGIV